MRSQTIDKLDKVDKPVAAGPFVDFVDFVDEGRRSIEIACPQSESKGRRGPLQTPLHKGSWSLEKRVVSVPGSKSTGGRFT